MIDVLFFANFISHQTYFIKVLFHPDGKHLIAQWLFGCCGQITTIDLQSDQLQRPLSYDEASFFSLSPDPNFLLATDEVTWSTYNIASPNLEIVRHAEEPFVHGASLRAISAVTADGLLGTIDEHGFYSRWDSKDWLQIKTAQIGFNPSLAAISPNTTEVVAVDQEAQRIVLWNSDSGETSEFHFSFAQATAIALGVELAYYGNQDGGLGWWNPWTGEFGYVVAHSKRINSILEIGSDILTSSDDGTMRRWRFNRQGQLDSTLLYHQSNTHLENVVVGDDNDLFVTVCIDEHGQLLHLNAQNGKSLGFAQTNDRSPLPKLDLPSCGMPMITLKQKTDLILLSSSGIYSLKRPIPNADAPFEFYLDPSTKDFYLFGVNDAYDDSYIVIHTKEGAAFKLYSNSVQLVVHHNYPITALTPINDHIFISAAYAYINSNGIDDWYSGVDMVITDSADYHRTSLIGHSDEVHLLAKHPSLPIFLSASDDGTLIIWGEPEVPESVLRGNDSHIQPIQHS